MKASEGAVFGQLHSGECVILTPMTKNARVGCRSAATGLSISKEGDTWFQSLQSVAAYDADYVAQDGRLLIGDPVIRESLIIKAIDHYTGIYRRAAPRRIPWRGVVSTRTSSSKPNRSS